MPDMPSTIEIRQLANRLRQNQGGAGEASHLLVKVADRMDQEEVEGTLTIDVIEDSRSWTVHYLGDKRWTFPKDFPSARARAAAFAEGARTVFRLTMPRTEIEILFCEGEG